MKFFLVLIFTLLTLNSTAQKAKKVRLNAYENELPSQFLPKKYTSYSAVLNLNGGEKKIFLDGEFLRNSNPLKFNTFWKEEDVFAKLTMFKLLKYNKDVKLERDDKLLLVVDIENARIDVKIEENLNQTLPYTYKYSWSIDVITTVQNSKTKEIIFQEKEHIGYSHKPDSKKKGFKPGFKTYKEAKVYVSKDADKNLIANEFYNNLNITQNYLRAFDVGFVQGFGNTIYKVSKIKKFPKAKALNAVVENTEISIDKLNKEFKAGGLGNIYKAKQHLNNPNLRTFKVSNDTLGLGYRKRLNELFKPLIDESDNLIAQLDVENKKEKSILWGLYNNKLTAACLTGKYEKAREIIEKLKTLDINERRTSGLEKKIIRRLESYNLLMSGKTKKGKEMNHKYFKYRAK